MSNSSRNLRVLVAFATVCLTIACCFILRGTFCSTSSKKTTRNVSASIVAESGDGRSALLTSKAFTELTRARIDLDNFSNDDRSMTQARQTDLTHLLELTRSQIDGMPSRIIISIPVYFDESFRQRSMQNGSEVRLCFRVLCKLIHIFVQYGADDNALEAIKSTVDLICKIEVHDKSSIAMMMAGVDTLLSSVEDLKQPTLNLQMASLERLITAMKRLEKKLEYSFVSLLYSERIEIAYLLLLAPSDDTSIITDELTEYCDFVDNVIEKQKNLHLFSFTPHIGNCEYSNQRDTVLESITAYSSKGKLFDLNFQKNHLLALCSHYYKTVDRLSMLVLCLSKNLE